MGRKAPAPSSNPPFYPLLPFEMSSTAASAFPVDDDIPSIRTLAGYGCLECDTCHYGMSSCPNAPVKPISHRTVLNAFGSRVHYHEWTPLTEDRFTLLAAYWIQCITQGISPYAHIHPPKSCFCGCPGSRLNFLDSIAFRPVSHVRDFYQHIIRNNLVNREDPTFQQAVAESLFKNRSVFTPLKEPYVDPTADGKEYRDSFLWIIENVLLPTTLRDARFTEAEDLVEDDDGNEVVTKITVPVQTLFHCLFELDSIRYYPEPEKYTRRMVVAFFKAGFDFTTPGCPSLMTAAIRSSNTDLIRALDYFDVPFAADAGDALLFRIRLTVGELCGMSHSAPSEFDDLSTTRGLNRHKERFLWSEVANVVYHSPHLLRAFANKDEDTETRKLRLTGILTSLDPHFSKYTSVDNSYSKNYLEGVSRILLPSSKQVEDLMKLLEVLRIAEFDFSAKYTWTPFYGEIAHSTPMTPRSFYNYYGRVVEALDPALDTAILAALKP